MGKKNKIKKPAALLAKKKVHERYLKEFSGRVPNEVLKHWGKEAERFNHDIEKLTKNLPQSYLEEIDRVSNAEVEKLLKKKRKDFG